MREFLYSEIANFYGVPNIPENPDLAIEVGRQLCENLLEPLNATFGRVAIRSSYRSVTVNDLGVGKHYCAKSESNFAGNCLRQSQQSGAESPWTGQSRSYLSTPYVGRLFVHATPTEDLLTPTREHRLAMGATQHPRQPEAGKDVQIRESPLALAIGEAAKKGVIELGVEGYTEVLIQCQKEQSSPALTTPFLRSDSQQAHCFRF
jgi:hypothetical protein